MKNIIIGLFGQAAAGKDTVADMLIDLLNNFKDENKPVLRKIAFAYNVKKIFCDYFDVDFNFIEQWKRNPESPPGFSMNVRQSLQMIGDGFRKVKNSVWIDKLINKASNVIVTDGRYLNEAIAIRQKGGINILINRPSHRNNDQNDSEKIMGEVSEYFTDKKVSGYLISEKYPMFDYCLNNDGNLKDLENKISDDLIHFILKSFN
jgi:hypothetical protein